MFESVNKINNIRVGVGNELSPTKKVHDFDQSVFIKLEMNSFLN